MDTSRITLDIPGEVVAAVKLPPDEIEQEFLKELALSSLYKRGNAFIRESANAGAID